MGELRNAGDFIVLRNSDSLEINIESTQNYDIGDVIGAREHITNIFVARPIAKKIVIIKGDIVTASYKVGR